MQKGRPCLLDSFIVSAEQPAQTATASVPRGQSDSVSFVALQRPCAAQARVVLARMPIRCSMSALREQDMKRAMLMVMLATSVMMIARAAQAPPNLSGTWRPQNAMSGQVNPFEFTITQTADSVTIRTPLNTPESVTLKLTGEESRTQVGGGQGGPPAATVTSRAQWEGSKLVVMSAITGGRSGPGSARLAYSLSGDTLTMETSNSLFDGSMTPVRTVTYVKYTPVPMPAPPTRTVESGFE